MVDWRGSSNNTTTTTSFNNTTTIFPPIMLESPPWWFKDVLPMVIIFFGIIGNTMTYIVLNKPKYSNISTCYYMKILAWSDNFVMLMFFIRWLIRIPNSPIQQNKYFCVLYFFSIRLGLSVSAWLLMLMTFERYVTVKFPLKARRICTINRARISIFAVVLVHIICHLPYFWRYSNPKGTTFTEKCPFNIPYTFNKIYKIMRLVIIDRFLPWLVILCFTIAMTIELSNDLKGKEKRLGIQKVCKETPRRVTAMSLVVAWVFFFLTFPFEVYDANRTFSDNSKGSVSVLIYEVFVYLLYLNSSINFYLYMMVARKFRKDVKVVFCGKLLGRENSNSSTRTNESYS